MISDEWDAYTTDVKWVKNKSLLRPQVQFSGGKYTQITET